MKRVAIVSDSVFPFHLGGKETRLRYLADGLVASGYDVHIYTMNWWGSTSDHMQDGVTYHAISKLYSLYDGDRRSIKEGVLFGLATFKLITKKFDVLEVDHMPFFPIYSARIVAWLKRRPLHATWHEVWGKSYWQEYLPGINGVIAYLIERLSVNLPDRIVAVSPMTAERLVSQLHCRRPIRVIGNGIDTTPIAEASYTPELASDIVYAGRLISHKGVDQLIAAVGNLVQTRPHVRCLIIGDGPESGRLRDQVKTAGLEQTIRFTGRLASNRDVMSAFKSSRVFVLPSVREGYGISVIEAMACGLPVVTVNHPDNAARLLITPGSGLVSEPTVEALTSNIAAILDHPADFRPRLESDIDWNVIGLKLAETYR